jgi:hypothetical protein
MRSQTTNMSDEPNLPCPHGRDSWKSCPHCLGVNTVTPQPKESIRGWEERFDALFVDPSQWEGQALVSDLGNGKQMNGEVIKSFISNLLSRTIPRSEVLELIEKLKAENISADVAARNRYFDPIISLISKHD